MSTGRDLLKQKTYSRRICPGHVRTVANGSHVVCPLTIRFLFSCQALMTFTSRGHLWSELTPQESTPYVFSGQDHCGRGETEGSQQRVYVFVGTDSQ